MSLFTPRKPNSDERLELDVSDEDHAKALRGRPWQAEVTDRPTGKTYLVRGVCCGIPTCFCDAEIVAPVLH